MKKFLPWIIVAVVIVAIVGWFFSAYNQFVVLDQDVAGKWSQVENQYQRRFDLIPNLVATVQGVSQQEQAVFLGVAEARAKVGQITVTPETLKDPQAFANFQNAQDQLGSSLSRLLVAVEAYPEIKSNQNFLNLQNQLEGTENRIAVARMDFNTVVQTYNVRAKGIPGKWLVSMFGFDAEKAFFKATTGAETAPAVQFNLNGGAVTPTPVTPAPAATTTLPTTTPTPAPTTTLPAPVPAPAY